MSCLCNNNITNEIPCSEDKCFLTTDHLCYTSLETSHKGCVSKKRCYSHATPFLKPLIECCEGDMCNENQKMRYILLGMYSSIIFYSKDFLVFSIVFFFFVKS